MNFKFADCFISKINCSSNMNFNNLKYMELKIKHGNTYSNCKIKLLTIKWAQFSESVLPAL